MIKEKILIPKAKLLFISIISFADIIETSLALFKSLYFIVTELFKLNEPSSTTSETMMLFLFEHNLSNELKLFILFFLSIIFIFSLSIE